MRITVLGCGNAGSAVAGDLAHKGHDVILCKTSDKMHTEHFKTMYSNQKVSLIENGHEESYKITVTQDVEHVIAGRDLIIIYIQTNYHKQLIQRISPLLEDGQMVLIEPGYLSSCFFLQYCKKDITLIEAESSPIDCRIVEPGRIKVLFRNVRNPLGVFPQNRTTQVIEALKSLDYSFEPLNSVAEAALHNPNLIVHTVGAILSIPRIEYVQAHGGSYSMYKEVFTPNVWRLAMQLDREKMDVLSSLGCKRIPYVEACKYRNSLDDDRDAEEVFFDYALNSAPDGPFTPDSRYLTEDVPQGLVLLESLGIAHDIETPVCTSLINIASALLGRDFRAEGRTIDILGRECIKRLLTR